LLGQYLASEYNANSCVNSKDYWGVYADSVDSDLADATHGGMDPGEAWQSTSARTGQWTIDDTTNQQIVQTHRHSFLQQPDDTLTIYTAIVSGRDLYVATLFEVSSSACYWYEANLRPSCWDVCACCKGRVGDLDGNGTDIGDLTKLIDYMFISYRPTQCPVASDINLDCNIDIGDVTSMISHLFITLKPFPQCPWMFDDHCEW
ncbi:MAG: hypothetical protein JSU65_14765, partial [Candidatus Zixiibacteriota bacterium]